MGGRLMCPVTLPRVVRSCPVPVLWQFSRAFCARRVGVGWQSFRLANNERPTQQSAAFPDDCSSTNAEVIFYRNQG